MRPASTPALLGTVLLVVAACGNNPSTTQPTAPTATYAGYPPPGYPQQGYPPPGYPPPQPGYPNTAPTPYPAPGPAPAPYPAPAPAPAPTTTAQLSTPGLLATPCQSDASCGLHHCNVQAGKCTFPCQLPTDCVSNNCVVGICLPGGGS